MRDDDEVYPITHEECLAKQCYKTAKTERLKKCNNTYNNVIKAINRSAKNGFFKLEIHDYKLHKDFLMHREEIIKKLEEDGFSFHAQTIHDSERFTISWNFNG